MTTSNKKKIRFQFFLIFGSFLAAYLCFSLLPNVFEIWNSQAVDQLFYFRASSDKFRLPYDKIQSIVRLKSTKQVQFKGVDHPVDIYDVVALEGRYAVKLPQKKKEKLSELNPSLPIDCFVLDEKTISDTAITGEIIQLGETVAEAVLKETVAAHANLRILITPEENNSLSEVYAKVLPSDAHDYKPSQNSVHLQFTWLSEEVKAYLAERRLAGQR